MIRVFLADDHPIIRTGLKQTLDKTDDIEVVGEASNGVEVLKAAREGSWDVLVLDLSLPQKNGWEVLRRLRVRDPDLSILVLSVHSEALYAVQALKMGASGYVTKNSDLTVCLNAIRKVSVGENFVSEDLAAKLVKVIGSASAGKDINDLLTEREMQVFMMIAEDKRLVEIAEELNISDRTVGTYRRRILEKLDLKSNGDIVRYAIKLGLYI